MTEREIALRAEVERLRGAIAEHHRQKADDRCVEDDDRLYAAAGLPPCDRRVGDKAAMLENCRRFIERRCQGGKWPSYVELEALAARLAAALKEYADWQAGLGRPRPLQDMSRDAYALLADARAAGLGEGT